MVLKTSMFGEECTLEASDWNDGRSVKPVYCPLIVSYDRFLQTWGFAVFCSLLIPWVFSNAMEQMKCKRATIQNVFRVVAVVAKERLSFFLLQYICNR